MRQPAAVAAGPAWPSWLPVHPTMALRVGVGFGLVLLSVAALVVPSTLSASPLVIRLAAVGVGGAIAASGIAIWERRPGNMIGPGLVLAGALWILARLQGAPIPVVALTANLANSLAQVVMLATLLAFPTGRLESRVARGIIVWGLIAATASNLLVASSVEVLRLTGQPNPIYVPLDTTVRTALTAVLQAAAYAAAIAGVAWLIVRWVRASGPARRAILPVFIAGVLISVIVLTCQFLINAGGRSDADIYLLVVIQISSFALLPAAIAISVLRSRMARGAVADLVVELGDTPSPARLRDALASALGDPSIRILNWSAAAEAFVDADGTPTELPDGDPGQAVTLLEHDGRPVAAIVHDPALADDPGLVASVATAVRLAVENERLTAEVRTQLDEVRASRARIVEAGDAERRRVERNLHDGAQQRLVALSFALRRARAELPADAAPEAASTLEEASEQLRAALAELRTLARGIHPAILTEAGLAPALRALARESSVPASVDVDVPDALPDQVAAAAYFVAAEALTNAAKYAEADHVSITAGVDGGELSVTIGDDGRGGADPTAGTGLLGLTDRLAALGGRLEIRSEAGVGTVIEARLPLHETGDDTDSDASPP